MTTGTKWTIGIVAVLIIGVVLWHAGFIGKTTQPPEQASTAAVANSNTQANASSTANSTGLPTPQSDTSNAALGQDEAAIDTQMQGLSSDSASVNQSLNDQPIQQSY